MLNVDDPTAQLRARARAGDADAFGAVFDACAKSVYNHAFRLTGDWSTAEEVMAMTFLEAWRGRDGILPDGGSLGRLVAAALDSSGSVGGRLWRGGSGPGSRMINVGSRGGATASVVPGRHACGGAIMRESNCRWSAASIPPTAGAISDSMFSKAFFTPLPR